jgi:hypothetical protein
MLGAVCNHDSGILRQDHGVVPGIDIGVVGQQKFRYILVVLLRRPVQWRHAVFIPAGNQFRMTFDQFFYLF